MTFGIWFGGGGVWIKICGVNEKICKLLDFFLNVNRNRERTWLIFFQDGPIYYRLKSRYVLFVWWLGWHQLLLTTLRQRRNESVTSRINRLRMITICMPVSLGLIVGIVIVQWINLPVPECQRRTHVGTVTSTCKREIPNLPHFELRWEWMKITKRFQERRRSRSSGCGCTKLQIMPTSTTQPTLTEEFPAKVATVPSIK